MNNLGINNVSNIPYSKENKVGYRSNISSSNENEFNTNALKDILELYNKYNSIEDDLNTIYECMNIENIFITDELNKIKQQIANTSNTIYVYANEVTNGELKADVKSITNDIVTSSSYSVSKIKIEKIDDSDNESKTIIIPKNINIKLNDYNNKNIIEVIDNDVKNILTSYMEKPFMRKVITNNNINDMAMDIIINIPDAIVDDYNINEITLIPFPANNIYIKDIQYRISNGTWNTIPSFTDHSMYVKDKGINANCRFNFNNITANQIKISLYTNRYLTNENTRTFILGIKNLDIRYKEINNINNILNISLKLPDRGKKIKSFTPIYNNSSQIEYDSLKYEFYYIDDSGDDRRISQSVPFTVPTDKIKVKIIVYNKENFVNISKFKIEIE